MKKISILGSTGSIGVSTCDVVRRHPDRLQIVAMACGKNIERALEQVREFRPSLVSVGSESDARELKKKIGDGIEVLFGETGAVQVASHPEVQTVVSAIVGAAGLKPTLAAIQAKKDIALANKETMVVAGEFMNAAAHHHGVKIFPVDSEHSAIFQCLNGEDKGRVRRLILTASGGPFLNKPREEFASISVEQALKHPNWSMGAKITIDSATLMNKGLELIEARWLFDVAPEQLDVCVHPQSIIHSMVEFQDSSVMAQLGLPDMRVPIAYALSYPDRFPNDLPSLQLAQLGGLTFFEPDEEKFRCLALAKQAMTAGGTMPAVLNAANEIAVQLFLERKISFIQIPQVVEETLQSHSRVAPRSLEEIVEIDRWARNQASNLAAA
ncbi:MAG TPA: 1-deoxy-D-xylulose-5-phosphate reductoisomerase [Deltaproteobacteria bacterium]|nr:1-deoxy-D-xylulose-5-phosphate reductoisomerase [Deltaproteobacteria bacterium]